MTDSEQVTALAARLDRLERQHRRLKWMGAAWCFLLVAIAAGAMGLWRHFEGAGEKPPFPRPALQGNSLWLWEDGRVPTVVMVPSRGSENDTPVELLLQDRLWGRTRAQFSMGQDHTALRLLDKSETIPRVVLSYGTDHSGLALFDEQGKKRAELVCTKDGPAIRLLDVKGKSVFTAP
jgi:hypothetical protein